MKGLLAGKVALVTGGSSGIGRASALAFANQGARVVVADVIPEDEDTTVSNIRSAGGEAIFVQTDVSVSGEVARLIARTVEEFGHLDCAHNNAGIGAVAALLPDIPEEHWDRLIDVNLKGVWLCMKYEIPQMLEQGDGGAIVNTASIKGLVGGRESAAYCASKGGVVQLTRAAALEFAASGIRVNAVCPGYIHTPMIDDFMRQSTNAARYIATATPLGRLGTPEEVAEAVVWLCSDAARFVTGHPLVVDGGVIAI